MDRTLKVTGARRISYLTRVATAMRKDIVGWHLTKQWNVYFVSGLIKYLFNSSVKALPKCLCEKLCNIQEIQNLDYSLYRALKNNSQNIKDFDRVLLLYITSIMEIP